MEIFQEFGNDLVVSDEGDLETVDGVALTNQRIVRRLLTTPISVISPPDYIDNPTYGAGTPQFIGQLQTPEIVEKITGLINSQIFLEDNVAQIPAPVITITGLPNQINCTILYQNILTNSQQVITVALPSVSADPANIAKFTSN